ncbi:MAG TPA: hypothetical protein ENH19_01010 [Actinobacteria bacterium]|nr:hypothetical protein [Actinomycetes bacterium]HEX21217.1 hypothetical protein [Actinomycetota bacterium]
MSTAQTIKTVGLFSTLAIMALGVGIIRFISRSLDPLFSRAVGRALVFGIVLTGIQVAGFILARG